MKQYWRWVLLVGSTVLASSCGGYPRLLNFPYDTGGRGLNSPTGELMPHIADANIVFVSDRNGSQDIYLFDADRRQLVELPGLNSLNAIASDPSISENGRYIAFTSSQLGISDIYLHDRETGLNLNLTKNLQAEVRRPNISADGSAIAFEANRNGQWDILIYDRFGKAID
ncbi:MAG: TolB family protein [Spirulina sp.]